MIDVEVVVGGERRHVGGQLEGHRGGTAAGVTPNDQELLAGAGQGLKNNGKAFSATLKRFAPLNRDISTLTGELAKRRLNLARLIHNLQLLLTEIGGKDKQLSQLVVSQNAVFQAFANQDRNLRRTLQLLPGVAVRASRGAGRGLNRLNSLVHCDTAEQNRPTVGTCRGLGRPSRSPRQVRIEQGPTPPDRVSR